MKKKETFSSLWTSTARPLCGIRRVAMLLLTTLLLTMTAQTAWAEEDETGALTVINTVTNNLEYLNDKEFTFTVTLEPAISGAFGDMNFVDGVATFQLTNGQSVTAAGLPTSLGYTVTVDPEDGFTSEESITGTIATDGPSIEFNHTYSAEGSVMLEAKANVENPYLQNKNFSFNLLNANNNVIQNVEQNNETGKATFAPINYTLEDLDGNQSKEFVYIIEQVIPEGAETINGWPANDGVAYEQKAVTVTVTVTDNGNGTLGVLFDGNTDFTIPEWDNKVVATVTADDLSKVYGENDPELTAKVKVGDIIINEGIDYSLSRVEGDNVGDYVITPVGELNHGYYTIIYNSGTLTINRKVVTITAGSDSKTYDGTALTNETFTATALESGDTHDFTVEMTQESTITNVGTQPNVIAKVDGVDVNTDVETAVGNYLVTIANGTLTVDPKAVTITAGDGSKTYDGTPLTNEIFTATALESGDTHDFTVEMTQESTITNAGTQPNVIAKVDGVDVSTGVETAVGNYLVTTVNGTLTVDPKAVTITAGDGSKTYDGTPLTNEIFTATALESGDTHDFTVVMTSESTITDVGTLPNVIAKVDDVPVNTGVETAVGNYLVTTANGTLTVDPKAVTITADNDSKTYDGTPLTKNTFTATALESGDSHIFNIDMTQESTITNAGTQPNVIAKVDDVPVNTGEEIAVGNYLVTTVNGTLTINPKTVTPYIENPSNNTYNGYNLYAFSNTPVKEYESYDAPVIDPSEYTLTVYVEGQDEPINVDQIKHSGTYTLVIYDAKSGEDEGNYIINEYSCNFVIYKAGLTVTANNNNVLYGNEVADAGVTYAGFVGNDNENVLEGTLTYTYSNEKGDYGEGNDVPGEYGIMPGGLTSTDYEITFVPGTLTITPVIVIVSVVDKADGQPIVGNQVVVRNSIGVIEHEWNSTEENHEISVLKAGGKYTIIGYAYMGYTNSAEYTLTIDENGNVSSYSGTITQDGVLLVENPFTRPLFAANSSNLWMTWCDKYDYVKPEGVTVYTVSGVENNTVTLGEVSESVIPAYTPVLLYRAAAGGDVVTATFSALGTAPASGYDSSSGIVEANLSNNVTLYGNSGDEAYASGSSNNIYIYAISDLSDTQSYVLRSGNFVAVDKDGGIGAHRCWLNVNKSAANGARLLSINTGGESSEIETTYFTNPANSSGAWYGLDGRKLDKQPTKKGLYI